MYRAYLTPRTALKLVLPLAILALCAPTLQAQRFVKVVDTVQDLVRLNPNDVHTNVFVADPARGGLFTLATRTTTNSGTAFTSTNATKQWNRQYDGTINVKWFNAKGDGTTDDLSAINAAFAATPAGGVLKFPAGTYRHTATITVTNHGMTILGPGTLQEMTSILAPQMTISGSNVVVKGLQFVGIESVGTWSSTTTNIQSRCNIIVSGNDCVLEGLVLSEKSSGIKVTGDRARLMQCRASNSWLTRSESNYHLSHAFLLYDDTGGMAVAGQVEKCHVLFGYGQGIGMVGDDNQILGNTVLNTLNNGIYNSAGSRNKIKGNTVIDPHDNGITSRGSQNEIIGNTVKGTLSADDSLRRGNVGIVPTAYDFLPTAGTPEALYTTAMGTNGTFNGFGNVVQGNIVSDFSVRGIEVGQLPTSGGIYTHGTVVSGNTLSNCGSGDNDESDPIGILVFGHDHRIIGNTLYSVLPAVGGFTPFGIEVSGNGTFRSQGVVVEANTIDGGGTNNTGIVLFFTTDCTVRGNRIMRQAGHGMRIIDCIRPIIDDNEFPDLDVFFDTTASSDINVRDNEGFAIGFSVTPTSGTVADNDVPNISLVDGLVYSLNDRQDYDWAKVTGASPDDYEITLNGALSIKRNPQGGGYAMTDTDHYVVITNNGTCTLPAAFTAGVGRMVIVKSANGVTTTLVPQFSDNIDAGGSVTLPSLAVGRYISDGGFNWESIGALVIAAGTNIVLTTNGNQVVVNVSTNFSAGTNIVFGVGANGATTINVETNFTAGTNIVFGTGANGATTINVATNTVDTDTDGYTLLPIVTTIDNTETPIFTNTVPASSMSTIDADIQILEDAFGGAKQYKIKFSAIRDAGANIVTEIKSFPVDAALATYENLTVDTLGVTGSPNHVVTVKNDTGSGTYKWRMRYKVQTLTY